MINDAAGVHLEQSTAWEVTQVKGQGVGLPMQGTDSSLANSFHFMLQELHDISDDSGDHIRCHDLAHSGQCSTGLQLIRATEGEEGGG